MNIRNLLSAFFNNSAVIGFIGVIIGSLITGFFAYKTQERMIASQENQFKSVYMIEKNKSLKSNLASFIDNLTNLTSSKDKFEKESILDSMNSLSMKIMLLQDYEIGQNCLDLTNRLSKVVENGKVNENEIMEIIGKWSLSIKTEMKKIDSSVDSNELSKDLLQLYLNGQLDK